MVRSLSMALEGRDVPSASDANVTSREREHASTKESLLPTKLNVAIANGDSMLGCFNPRNDDDLRGYINLRQDGDEIRLCPGIVDFSSEIELTKSVTISCAGPKRSCILDGNGGTRHFVSNAGGLTLAFVDLSLINGFVLDGDSLVAGGSVFLSGTTSIFDGCFFYNNRVTSSTGVVSII